MSLAQAGLLRRCELCGEALTEFDGARCPSCGQDLRAYCGADALCESEALAGPAGSAGPVAPGARGPVAPHTLAMVARVAEPDLLSVPQMRYQNGYVWLVLVSALDVMLTMVVLVALQGFEVNPVAAAVIETMGFPGATAFKFGVVVLVVVICEIVGRKDDQAGRNLIRAAILISALPVAYSFALIFVASNA